jgi:hypothetical protein
MIPQKFSPFLFGLILSGLMSLLVSGISMLRAVGLAQGFVASWMDAWLFAFPIVLLVAPLARAVVIRVTARC